MDGMTAMGALGSFGFARQAGAANHGFGLQITGHSAMGRLHYSRFATSNIG